MQTILVVGGSGFVGRNLYEYLSPKNSEYKVLIPNRQELNVGNETQVREYLTQNSVDVVIHGAIYNGRKGDPNQILEQNLRMFYHFEKNQDLFQRMIYFGSGAEFNKRYDICNIKEEEFGHRIPADPYGLSKYTITKIIEQSEKIYNLRIFGLFGKYENWRSTFISNACCKAIKNLPISIRQNVFFDYLFIDDFCRIMEWFLKHTPEFKTYNITSGQRIDLISLAELVMKVHGLDTGLFVCREGLAKEYTSSNQRLRDQIGEITLTPMEDAVRSLYEYYRTNEDEIDLYDLLYNNN